MSEFVFVIYFDIFLKSQNCFVFDSYIKNYYFIKKSIIKKIIILKITKNSLSENQFLNYFAFLKKRNKQYKFLKCDYFILIK